MPFTDDFIASLANKDDIAKVKIFNSLPIDRAPAVVYSNEILEMSKNIEKLVAKSKIQSLLNGLKTGSGVSYSTALSNIVQNVFSISELYKISDTLKTLPSSSDLNKLISEIDNYIINKKEIYSSKGLYGCLSIVGVLLNSLSSQHSLPFQYALLTGVVNPVWELFEDLELRGDLTIDSIDKLKFARVKLFEALNYYQATKTTIHKEKMEKLDVEMNAILQKKLDDHNVKISEIQKVLGDLQQDYKNQASLLSPNQKDEFENKIKEMELQIEQYNAAMERSIDTFKKHIEKKKSELAIFLEDEGKALDISFKGISEELSYIESRVRALDAKKQINMQYPSLNDKKRKKAIAKLQEKSEFAYLVSDRARVSDKDYVKKRGGRLLKHLQQGALAAMGKSNGLCGGYSAEFLKICSSPDWENLSFESKMKKFKEILQIKDSFRLDVSANPMHNDLMMTLESGLRWDIQSQIYQESDSKVFEIKQDDKNHATSSSKRKNAKAFFQKLVDGLMNNVSDNKSSRLMLTFFDQNEGHAVGLNHDKDGFLFHDSNTGYIHFKDKDKFAKFLVEYLYKNYQALSVHCSIYNFDVINRNINKYNVNVMKEQKFSMEDATLQLELEKEEIQLSQRFDLVKSNIHALQSRLNQSSRAGLERQETPKTTEPISSVTDSIAMPPVPLTESAPKSKREKVVFSQKNTLLPQIKAVEKFDRIEKIKSLLDDYLKNYDTVLDERQVLKNRLFHEIKCLSETNPDLTALRKLSEQNKLEKCAELVKQIDDVLRSQPEVIKPGPQKRR